MKYKFELPVAEVGYPNLTDLKPGDEVLVVSRENELTDRCMWLLYPGKYARDGYPGNISPEVRCFHGWRGTTNNVAVYAHGVYRVKSVESKDDSFWGECLKVTIDREDLKKDCE